MSNPFDPFASSAPPPVATHYGAPPAAQPSPSNQSYQTAPPSSQAPQYPPQQQQYGQQYGQQPYTPSSVASAASAPAFGNQMVVAQQQTNPYAGVVQPAPSGQNPMQHQAMVPATQPVAPGSQWGMAPTGYPAPAPAGSGNLFDPLAPPPAAPPAPPPPPPPTQHFQAPVAPAQPVYDDQPFPFESPSAPTPVAAPAPPERNYHESQPSFENQDNYGREGNYGPPDKEEEDRDPKVGRNKYSNEIARSVPGASALPKAELVKKSGWVLSRISFRTILTKKWKQSYWVQYGSHTMLWFRSQQDFEDWLNNPYHNQAQRNFLIKLAVNFVHDLYKPNVRGYQVTQSRAKPYGSKMVRQFKLERWMDYGPTIAAAFGSYDPQEVDKLRAAIVECMKNTPLEGGVRPTGAIKQHHEEQAEKAARRAESERYPQNGSSNSERQGNDHRAQSANRSVVSVNDLLDSHNGFDESASYPNLPNYGQQDPAQAAFAAYSQHPPPQSYPAPAAAPPQPPQQQQMQPYYSAPASAPQPYPTPAGQQQYPGYGQAPAQQQQYQFQQPTNF